MTYRQICECLSQAGIDGAEWDARLLVAHFCGADPVSIPCQPDLDYPSPALTEAVERRAARYPLQYLLGEWEFYRQSYEVSPDCLIPRSDTEILVETAVSRLPRGAHFVDLCTGSGCIAISTLAERPDTTALAVEKFETTLSLACRNAVRNRVQDRFTPLAADVLLPHFLPPDLQTDAILSNPPYIRTDVLSSLAPELSAEPTAALDGGEDGLLFYRRILQSTLPHLKRGGFYLFEIGYDQADALSRLARDADLTDLCVLKDYGGNDRVFYCKKKD